MGVDVHFGDHYFALFHVPKALLFVLASIAVFLAFKLGRVAWAALGVLFR